MFPLSSARGMAQHRDDAETGEDQVSACPLELADLGLVLVPEADGRTGGCTDSRARRPPGKIVVIHDGHHVNPQADRPAPGPRNHGITSCHEGGEVMESPLRRCTGEVRKAAANTFGGGRWQ